MKKLIITLFLVMIAQSAYAISSVDEMKFKAIRMMDEMFDSNIWGMVIYAGGAIAAFFVVIVVVLILTMLLKR